MSWYIEEAKAKAEEAVEAFLQVEIENGNVCQADDGTWVWRVEDAIWPMEIPVDPNTLDGQIAAGYGECSAYEPCDADHDYMCELHSYSEMEF